VILSLGKYFNPLATNFVSIFSNNGCYWNGFTSYKLLAIFFVVQEDNFVANWYCFYPGQRNPW
jgi:hypothetical protein